MKVIVMKYQVGTLQYQDRGSYLKSSKLMYTLCKCDLKSLIKMQITLRTNVWVKNVHVHIVHLFSTIHLPGSGWFWK